MSITETIKEYIGGEEAGAHLTEYRCTECGHVFESAKTEDRAQCMECLSNDVEPTS